MTTYPDHLIIVAPTLEAGSAFVMDTLGVSPQMGGKHEKMGTHNMLLRLGEFLYLEIIAPDRAAPNPNRPRWFNMDQVNHHSSPALLTWAVRTSDIEKTSAGSLQPLGVI